MKGLIVSSQESSSPGFIFSLLSMTAKSKSREELQNGPNFVVAEVKEDNKSKASFCAYKL